MTPRRALWIAGGASLLIQLFAIGSWWWGTDGCFCSVGTDRDVSDLAYALFQAATYPINSVPPRWLPGHHPLIIGIVNFELWFAAIFVPLRIGMLAFGARRPVAGRG